MEFKSTLERAKERYNLRIDQAIAKGYKEPPEIEEIFNLIKDSKSLLKTRTKTIEIARNMQPSITDEDLKIASDMQLACASFMLLSLIKEGLITIKEDKE